MKLKLGRIFDEIEDVIVAGVYGSEKNRCGFYDLYIMLPEEPIHPENQYKIEFRTKHASEVRWLLNTIDEEILCPDSNLTEKDREDIFHVFLLGIDYLLFDAWL